MVGYYIGIPPLTAPKATDVDGVGAAAEAQLLDTVRELKSVTGTGQEQGDEADGPGVNHRRAALSVLMSRYSTDALEAKLPKSSQGKALKRLRDDIAWLERAERQPISQAKAFDFKWSKNPMSTPKVLHELAKKRAAAATLSASAIEANPSQPYDASNDSLLCHLELNSPGLRAQVLADTLIQFRAKRRSEALMDSALVADDDPEREMTEGRFGSSGTVSAYEQRLAAKQLANGTSLDRRREYALTRLVVGNATSGSVNGIFTSRNTIGILPDYMGMGAHFDPIGDEAGLGASIHATIHRNYSANTPKAVDYYLRNKVFAGGPDADRVEILKGLVGAARASTADEAATKLGTLAKDLAWSVPEAKGKTTIDDLRKAVVLHIEKHCALSDLKEDLSVEGKLRAYELLLAVHKSVCVDRPTADDLEKELFYAGKATSEVAALIHALRKQDCAARLEAVGRARTALRGAFFKSASGFERQMLWRLDRKVELMSAELLGSAVERVEASDEPQALGECLIATRSALRGVLASGLDSVRGRKKTAKVEDLAALLKQTDAMLAKKKVSVDDVRALMTQVFASASEVADTLRGFFYRREGAIRFSDIDVDLDPEFTDNLIKESPLHYLLSLSQRGMTFGLKSKISSDEIQFVSGMRVLNSTGPRVYERILVGSDAKSLKKYAPSPNDLLVITSSNQKDLLYGGGMILDSKDAGPGYSHASVFAKGHGISAIALPNLSAAVKTFFSKAQGDGGAATGFYVDDRPGSFVIKPLASAIDEGLLKTSDVERLRPGFNLDIDYLDVTEDGDRIIADHSKHHLSEHHDVRHVELFVPDVEGKLGLDSPPSFADLKDVALDVVRQNAGEKGAVLVRLAQSSALAKLGVDVPAGAIVPPAIVRDLLDEAQTGGDTLYDAWHGALADPAFADASARLGVGDDAGILARMQKRTKAALTKLLLKGNQPTSRGKAILQQLAKHPGLKGKTPWILRSSFTGEDRPYKSGAGQYSSFPNCVSAKQRLDGLIGVIASAWNAGAVESNLASGIDLAHVWPSIVVQKCLQPTVSGVAVSRGETGGFGEVSYQAKPKFGGGVDGGAAEEGTLKKAGTSVSSLYKSNKASLLTASQQQKLRAAIMTIEEQFNNEIEPGKQFAVDVEWAFEGNQLHILQARVITGV